MEDFKETAYAIGEVVKFRIANEVLSGTLTNVKSLYEVSVVDSKGIETDHFVVYEIFSLDSKDEEIINLSIDEEIAVLQSSIAELELRKK